MLFFVGCTDTKDSTVKREYDPGFVYITSYPSGLKVYIVPQKVANGDLGQLKLRAEEYLAGITPISQKLDPGKYSINVEADPHVFFDDGEDSKLFIEKDDRMFPFCKTYDIEKEEGTASLVTALFREKDQSLSDFVKLLPKEKIFEVSDLDFFHQVFKEHSVPADDWDLLMDMLRRTGKLAWHGETKDQFLFAYYTQPGLLAVKPLL